MFTLRIVRHDRGEHVLAECRSACLPARGELLQLDTVDGNGEKSKPSTVWRVIGVTLHVPSQASNLPSDGSPLSVQLVEVTVLPDVALSHDMASTAHATMTDSRR